MLNKKELDSAPYKYLLYLYCTRQGYWDTFGYCHWSEDAFSEVNTFKLDNQKGLCDKLAWFKDQYPNGEYEIHIIKDVSSWDYECEDCSDHISSLIEASDDIKNQIRVERGIKEENEKREASFLEASAKRAKELELLKSLKEKEIHYKTKQALLDRGIVFDNSLKKKIKVENTLFFESGVFLSEELDPRATYEVKLLGRRDGEYAAVVAYTNRLETDQELASRLIKEYDAK